MIGDRDPDPAGSEPQAQKNGWAAIADGVGGHLIYRNHEILDGGDSQIGRSGQITFTSSAAYSNSDKPPDHAEERVR